MTGAQEAPGPGDPDGTGTASFWINPGQEELCFVLEVQNIAPANAAISTSRRRRARPGRHSVDSSTTGTSSGASRPIVKLLVVILMDLSADYVNVDNTDFQPGAIRGQLSR